MTDFRVQDGERLIEFSGRLLAEVSSHEPGKRRWIELTLYRTLQGTYVLAGVGRSIVEGETQRRWAQISLDPDGIIERLHMIGDGGTRYIPNTSRKLLREAGYRDDRIREAFATERIA